MSFGSNEEFMFFETAEPIDFSVASLKGSEGISMLYGFELELLSEDPDITFDEMIGQGCVISIQGNHHSEIDGNFSDASLKTRYIHGVVSDFCIEDEGEQFSTYKVKVVPKIWPLQHRINSRIFQKQSVHDIVISILKELGLEGDEYRWDCKGTYAAIEYCVQYGESEFDFMSRLLEEEGIFYFFEHSNDKHVLVFYDDSFSCKPIEDEDPLSYISDAKGMVSNQSVSKFYTRKALTPGLVTFKDYNFLKPTLKLEAEHQNKDVLDIEQDRELYQYGYFDEKTRGKHLAKIQMESLNTRKEVGHGASNANRLCPGFLIEIDDRRRGKFSGEYLLSKVTHNASQQQAYQQYANTQGSQYANEFECVLSEVVYRPEIATKRPLIEGSQTAIVTGPKGEEIYTDEHGRVKVQFHWERYTKSDEESSCWVRVSNVWAGQGYGGFALPRIGQEVIVSFINGNPDQPIITGRLHHGHNTPPYRLPAQKAISTLKTQSTKGGEGFNELRFNDAKGTEQLFTHAERNLDRRIQHDQFEFVGHNDHSKVIHDAYTEIGNDQHSVTKNDAFIQVQGEAHLQHDKHLMQFNGGSKSFDITGDRYTQVKGSDSVQTGVDIKIEAAMNYGLNAGQNIDIKSASDITLEASNISLKGGGGILISSGAIFIKGAVVNINNGGSPSPAKPKAPDAPKLPTAPEPPIEADTALAGKVETVEDRAIKREKAKALQQAEAQKAQKRSDSLQNTLTSLDNTTDSKMPVNEASKLAGATQGAFTASTNDKDDTEETEFYELASLFAREQLYVLAKQLAEAPFMSALVTTFGSDIPVEAYAKLYELASDKSLPALEITVTKGSIKGRLGAFDSSQNKILVAESLVKSAIDNDDDKAKLMALLIEEYGHSIDYMLRNSLSSVGGDAMDDEGAKFAYQLISFEQVSAASINFAQVTSTPYSGDLVIDNAELSEALASVSSQEQMNDDKDGSLEFFGAGTGDANNPASYGHQSIEFVLAETGFDEDSDLPRIYFGNWLRDFSQFVDPAIVRPSNAALKRIQNQGISIPGLDTLRLSRQALTDLVALLAGMEFSQFGETLGTYCYKYVNTDTLGVYRPEEHIDNPYSQKNGKVDNSLIDKSFTPPYIETQVQLNEETGLKNYINTPVKGQTFGTAVQYMTQELEHAKNAGSTSEGLLHFGQALHVLEDYFSHSNFVEVCLIKLGNKSRLKHSKLNELARNIYPVVETSNVNGRIPIVTGRFGQTDVLASIGPKLAQLFQASFTDYEQAKPGERSPAQLAIKIVLKDLAAAQTADSKKEGTNYTGLDYADYLEKYEQLLLWQDELLRTKNKYLSKVLLSSIHYLSQTFIVIANFAIHHIIETVAHNIDDAQTILGDTGENPTHSQLAKDHDTHHFHELAALMAIEAVESLGESIKEYWGGVAGTNPVELAQSIIAHPLDIQIFDQIAIDWANANEDKLRSGNFKSDIHEHHDNFKQKAKDLRKEVEGMNKYIFDTFNYLRSYFE
ncbi:type VI secretion system tip protein TssI/VgrG [Ningiella sp. W23]|uniref:type VI secretion system tip protein TssI/VgrG n=1 Tax=Ningiella sp. W23 TaxID=3023715 RepID=UPI003756B331